MTVPTHLLERAHQLINANQFQNAELVLDAVVRVEPQNVDAWMAYLRINQSQTGLDWLKERVLKTKELNEADKAELVDYYHYLSQQLNCSKEANIWAETFTSLPELEQEEITTTEETVVRFELIDVFDYPIRLAKIESFTTPRQRRIYNPFSIEFVSEIGKTALKAMSHDPLWQKIETHIQKPIALVKEAINNPKNTYAKLLVWPHFEKYVGIALLTLFVLGVRLVISNYFFGYAFLGIFIVGGGWWLVNFGNRNMTSISSQSRVYLHEYKINLPEIKEVQISLERKPDEANSENDPK